VDCAVPITAMAVNPAWPQDPTLLALRNLGSWQQELIRTRDGGHTWQRLPYPGLRADGLLFTGTLALTPSPDGGLITWLVGGTIEGTGFYRYMQWQAWRSGDLGTTWQAVPEATVSGRDRPAPRFVSSPASVPDGAVWLVADGVAWHSTDSGQSWSRLREAAAQYVGSVAVSPDYARDRTVAMMTTSVRPEEWVPRDAGRTELAPSGGVLVSRDGGRQWEPPLIGLEVEGTRYSQVELLQFSPTYAQDRALFALASRPAVPDESTTGLASRLLFRSGDGGATWQPVSTPAGFGRPGPVLALSPQFATDGLGYLAITYSGGSPSSSNCALMATTDHGATWEVRLRDTGTGSASCGEVQFVMQDDQVVALRRYFQYSDRVVDRSEDGGRTWTSDGPVLDRVGFWPLAQVGGTEFAVQQGMLWARGSGRPLATAQVPCPPGVADGLVEWGNQTLALRGQLGCPLRAARAVDVYTAEGFVINRPGRAYWPDDGLPAWLFVPAPAAPGSRARATVADKDRSSWPLDAPSELARGLPPRGSANVVSGQVQEYEAAVVLLIPGTDGTLVEVYNWPQSWAEIEFQRPP
jgi:photosystem II stability/assembly factor-like uncharacterized protein